MIFLAVVVLGIVAIVAMARQKPRGSSGSLSIAALEIQSLLEPEKKRVVETRRAEEDATPADESGDSSLRSE